LDGCIAGGDPGHAATGCAGVGECRRAAGQRGSDVPPPWPLQARVLPFVAWTWWILRRRTPYERGHLVFVDLAPWPRRSGAAALRPVRARCRRPVFSATGSNY